MSIFWPDPMRFFWPEGKNMKNWDFWRKFFRFWGGWPDATEALKKCPGPNFFGKGIFMQNFSSQALKLRKPSTKFCTGLPDNSGKVLNTSMTPKTWPPDPRVPQTPKPKQITGEKTLLYKKCPDGWRKLIKFFLSSAGAWLASLIYNMP